MPKKSSIKRVLVIGSGSIVIGQAAEFDYAGTQACQALREEGIEVILVNSNPATIMTDRAMADKIYIEPLTINTIKRIIEKEKPDSLLSTLGGQTALTLSMQLAKEGFLEEQGVVLLGAKPETIDKAEDRQLFKDTLLSIGQPVIPSAVVTTVEDAVAFAKIITYPVIIRPAFTLGGSGGGIAETQEELVEIAENGLRLSPITQILVEKSVAGYKEIEFEVVRDNTGNAVIVCPMENVDPVGIHTGDSIVVAPTVTLSEHEISMLRQASLDIVNALEVEGGCNCQYALHPTSGKYAVIEVNPRVSRSSALASKATGYPIARIATKIAIGYTLAELVSPAVDGDPARFEPSVEYCVIKFPRWAFDKFVYASRKLGTQMKATGEVMAIGDTFEHALLKAVRGAEISQDSLRMAQLGDFSDEEIRYKLQDCDDQRLFVIYEAIARGISVDDIFEATKITRWFLERIEHIYQTEEKLCHQTIDEALYLYAKKLGFTDQSIEQFSRSKLPTTLTTAHHAHYRVVTTCRKAFHSSSPYFYSTFSYPDEAEAEIAKVSPEKGTVMVLGSGPIRIGQGIEFDYASVHSVWSLQKQGYRVVIVNNNPETVSTDYNTADRLYFEPLTPEDVRHIIHKEKPLGVVVAFGGQTAIKLIHFLEQEGVPIIGTSANAIDQAEDREKFDALLEQTGISRPAGRTIRTTQQALEAAHALEYPVLLRPSYVLGGQNMVIAFSEEDITEYMDIILKTGIENPILIDQYLRGTEVEIDAICDGEEILIPGIMEHIERAGVHSGDSIAVYPTFNVTGDLIEKLIDYTKKLALALNTRGLVNIQYVIYHHKIYVIEVNPRASRTIPYISKVTGIPMVELATRAMLGEKLKDMGYGIGLYPKPPYVAVKVPVFSFEKLPQLDTHLGPEMKSTGEVLGIGRTLDEALYKGILASGSDMKKDGGVFITVRDSDKPEMLRVAEEFAQLGFSLYATGGTASALRGAELTVTTVDKIHEGEKNGLSLIHSGRISYVISTSSKGRNPARDSVRLRRAATEKGIPCLTSIDTAAAVARVLRGQYSEYSTELVDINHMRSEPVAYSFTKIQIAGNGHLHFDVTKQALPAPESMSIILCNPHYSIGADGIVLLGYSAIADASMRYYNKDGTEAKVGGNALHGAAKYLYENGIVKKNIVSIDTHWGVREVKLYTQDGVVESSTVNLGSPSFDKASLPTTIAGTTAVSTPLVVGGKEYLVTYFSIGNPYCVVFDEYPDHLNLEKLGPLFEYHPDFPERVNTVYVAVEDTNTIRMRIWERGNGETYSSGTGACAAVVAAVLSEHCTMGSDVTVKQRGGEVIVNYSAEGVSLTAQAKEVFTGIVTI